MKWALYNILFALVYPFLLPGFLLRMLRRGGYANRFLDRFALYPPFLHSTLNPQHSTLLSQHPSSNKTKRPAFSNLIWLHAVSVGEVQVAGQLMREWRAQDPTVRFCFSTTSSTGWMMAQRELASLNPQSPTPNKTKRLASPPDLLIYNPLDFPNFVKSALKRIRPRAIILTESEIWPNFILTAKRYHIPLFLINARVSDRSAPRYKLARYFFKDVLSSFTRIFAQSDLDKERLVAAGAPADIIDVTGSFKFDVAHRNEAKEKELRDWIFSSLPQPPTSNPQSPTPNPQPPTKLSVLPQPQPPILLGGSTWPGEDEVLIRIYKKLCASPHHNSTLNTQHSTLSHPLLVLAPRHFEKADQVEANILKAGFTCIRRSRKDKPNPQPPTPNKTKRLASPPVFLCDTTGEMMGLFGICDAAFVGKSLCAHGSQNMIEPCLCGKPTVVGPYTENFRPVMSDLKASDAIVQVRDADELERTILSWFSSGDQGLGERAKAAVLRRCGVVQRCVAAIRHLVMLLLTFSLFTFHFSLLVGCSRSEAPAVNDAPRTIDNSTVVAAQNICDSLGGVTNGLNVVRIDTTKFDCNALYKSFKRMPPNAVLWMLGEFDWLVTWSKDGAPFALADMMERYGFLESVAPLSSLFGAYVGTISGVMPAFAELSPETKVVPELFVTKTVPALDGFSLTGVDDDILSKFSAEVRESQAARRMVLEGDMLMRDKKPEQAIKCWAAASQRNKYDSMLQERLNHLKLIPRGQKTH